MAMLQVECRDCGATFSLRGWIEPEDLIGTQWEGYTNQDIVNAEKILNDDHYGLENKPRYSKC